VKSTRSIQPAKNKHPPLSTKTKNGVRKPFVAQTKTP